MGKTKLAENPQPAQPNPESSDSEDDLLYDDKISEPMELPETPIPSLEPQTPEEQEIDTPSSILG